MTSASEPEPAGHRDGAFGLWRDRDRVLLVSNLRTMGGRRRLAWDLPGGTARPGEALSEALAREWREEIGLTLEVGALALVSDGRKLRGEGQVPLYTWRAFVFEVTSEGTPRAGTGIDEVAWVPVSEACDRLQAPYHAPLRRYLGSGQGGYARVDWVDPLPSGAGHEPGAEGLEGLRRLLVVAAAAAAGDGALVVRATEDALADEVQASRVAEVLLQVVPYAGFPRAIAAFAAVQTQLGGALMDTVPETLPSGAETFARVYGETAPRVMAGLARLHPKLAEWTEAFPYGTVLGRPGLSLLERELLAVSILTALGRLGDPLLGHMRAARRLGASQRDVAAAVEVVPHSLGEAKREEALALLERL